VAVATNSADIKVYNMADQGCQLLRGHTDFVLTLACCPSDPSLLLSSGKVRILYLTACYSLIVQLRQWLRKLNIGSTALVTLA